jgi:hypothetical protein
MASLSSPVNISLTGASGTTWYRQQRNFYRFNTTSGSPSYIHMKTNINTIASMFMIEAVGYNYGAAAAIRCSWGFYLGASYTLPSNAAANGYSGLQANGTYMSSDNYVVIRAYAGGLYYCGFCLNAYATRDDSACQAVSIQAASQNSTSGNYY